MDFMPKEKIRQEKPAIIISGGISLANVVGITHIFHALTFSGSRGSCLNTRQGHINNSELILSIFTFKPMF